MAHFEDFREQVEEEKDRAVEEAEELAVIRVPIDTGRLREDISSDADEDKVFNTLHYAPHQDLGTSTGIEPTFYMKDSALDAFRDSIDRLTT